MSLISNSSDVWAALVANIGPLLILVGENHVKAYFKTMCRTSHHLLFASSPIGLVTAVTTLIRLNGSPILKRMIGRQFETRAQVLVDVTSVSSGAVGLELINLNLEQTLTPTDDNLAMFWIHGRKYGSADDITQWVKGLHIPILSIAFRTIRSASDTYDRRCACSVYSVFRAKGPGAIWMARKHVLQALQSLSGEETKVLRLCESQINRLDPGASTTCEGVGCVYARWTDVSLVLTASASLDGGVLEILRYTTVALSLTCNVGIIVASWYSSHDGRNVGLVTAGIFISGAGTWLTAWLVDKASQEEAIDLSPFSAHAAGFFSKKIPEGASLSFCPKVVVMSTDNQLSQRGYLRYTHLITTAAVGLMVMAYIGLYMGLRASVWWFSLAMLGIAAITATARSLLVPGSLYLVSPSRSPQPIYLEPFAQPKDVDLQFPPVQAPPVTSIQATPPSEPVMIDDVYEVAYAISTPYDQFRASQSGSYARLLGTSLQLAYEMRKRNIAPLEWKYWQDHAVDTASIITLYSDLMSQRGVWRQPLELSIFVPFDMGGLEKILVLVGNWYRRASAISACKIAELSLDPEIKRGLLPLDDDEERMGSVTDKLSQELSTRVALGILWMTVKIMYGFTYQSILDRYEGHLFEYFDRQTENWFSQELRESFLDSIVAAGLTCPHSNVGTV